MGNKTSVKTVGIAAGITVVMLWLTGFYQPELMATAPVGLEAAVTAIIASLAGYLVEHKE